MERLFHRVVPPSFECPPDGGWGWVVVAASFFAHVIVLGLGYAFGVLYRALLEDPAFSGGDRGATAWIGSIAVAMMLASGVVVGHQTQVWGHRRVAFAGALLVPLGLVASSAVPSLPWLYVTYGVITGAGFACSFQPAVMIISRYFVRRRALATGIAVAGSGVGTLLFAVVSDVLLSTTGWRGTLQIFALVSLLVLSAAAVTYVPVLNGHQVSKGTQTEGRSAIAVTLPAGQGGEAAEAAAAAPPPPQHHHLGSQRLTLKEVWTHPAFLPVGGCLFVYGGGLFSVYGHLVVAAGDGGLSSEWAARLVSWVGLAGMAGRIVFGRIQDNPRVDRILLLQVTLSIAGLSAFGLAFLGPGSPGWDEGPRADTAAAMPFLPYPAREMLWIILAVVFGGFSGGVVSQVPPLMADGLGLENLPTSMGAVYTIQAPAVLLGPPAAGWARAAAGNYYGVFLFVGIGMTLAPFFLVYMPGNRCALCRGRRE